MLDFVGRSNYESTLQYTWNKYARLSDAEWLGQLEPPHLALARQQEMWTIINTQCMRQRVTVVCLCVCVLPH